ITSTDDGDVVVGYVLKNKKIKCRQQRCAFKTFGRQAEFERHYKNFHAAQKQQFWCHIISCNHAQAKGGDPFPRKDKLIKHVREAH
ncbi:hypothetical protein P153DRAFT_252257, partial [Dothidotthia symphoricarpi CBS 119687]